MTLKLRECHAEPRVVLIVWWLVALGQPGRIKTDEKTYKHNQAKYGFETQEIHAEPRVVSDCVVVGCAGPGPRLAGISIK